MYCRRAPTGGTRSSRRARRSLRPSRRVLLWLLATLLIAWPSAARADEPVWEALRAPGSIVVLRHSYAPGGFDPPDAKLDDCSTQRNLDDNGRAQARRVGEAFRAHGITVGRVLSSPRCRCLDTARLAFGKVEPWEVLQGALRDTELRRRLLIPVKQAIADNRDGAPLVLVTHGSVVSDLTGLDVRMGTFVVLRRGADGAHSVIGQLYVE
ncbi:MAG: histidine phosphatase family protein [Candidatus Rokuibacteriota bacterium]|nr:MAG: histidine phosphatase family protein [Candidatus Rokubacteria bacterium]